MNDLQVMIIDLVTALENDDVTYIKNADTFWNRLLEIYNKLPKENIDVCMDIDCIVFCLGFNTDKKEIIEKLKEIYRNVYGKNI